MKKSKKILVKDDLYGYLMILPAMFFFVLFLLFPVFKAFQISFYNYSGIGEMVNFIGLDNYIKSLSDTAFLNSLINTLKLMLFDLGTSLPLAFILAYLIYINIPGWRFFSITLFIPHIVPIIVAALVWRFMYETNFGLVNSFLRTIGMDSLARNWLGTYETAFASATVAWVWKSIPFPLLVFYGAMLRIPKELFEAAKIDGANGWQTFKNILVPLMAPVISMLLILSIATTFRSFDMLWVLTQGGPGNSTTISAIHIFKQAFLVNKYGYANALAVEVIFIVGGIVTLGMTLLRKKQNQ